MEYQPNRRILVIDDNQAIHADFKKVLVDPVATTGEFADAEAALFDDAPAGDARASVSEEYTLDFASQGREGYEMLRAAALRGEPYALAFVDVRMPPGWDGVETIAKMWSEDSELQTVICTAFADYSWQEMIAKLGRSDRLLILKKPFDPIEVRQLASALTEKWNSTRRERMSLRSAQIAEQEARAYAASLETVNDALETSRKAAEANSNAKAELLLHLAQSLSAPMTALLDSVEQLDPRNSDGAERLDGVPGLIRDSRLLRRSLQDVLDLSALETGTLQVELSTFSPRQLAQEVLGELRWKATQRSLALELECAASNSSTLEGDAGRIRHMLRHLVDNAIEHTPAHGFVRVVLSSRQSTGWLEPQLCIEVIDSGAGFSREQESAMFEPFCHAHDPQSTPSGHFGLGLCVSKRMAQRLGGDLTLETAPGMGCRFVLTLRAAAHSART